MGKRVGIVTVHGIGDQHRYGFLKEFTTSVKWAADRRGLESDLYIDKVELNRPGARTLETSDLFGFFR